MGDCSFVFITRTSRRAPTKAARRQCYRHNPYSLTAPFEPMKGCLNEDALRRTLGKQNLPQGTIRVGLYGLVNFVPFRERLMTPSEDDFHILSQAPPASERPDTLKQLFFGQLPFRSSDALVIWLCDVLAESPVLFIERIVKNDSQKGCMQVFVDEADVEYITTALNKRVVFDATGVWHAQDHAQVKILEAHCKNEANRHKGLPYNTMVAEVATSTYIRRPPRGSHPEACTTLETCMCPDCMAGFSTAPPSYTSYFAAFPAPPPAYSCCDEEPAYPEDEAYRMYQDEEEFAHDAEEYYTVGV